MVCAKNRKHLFALTEAIAELSECKSRKVGCMICANHGVAINNNIIAIGYNRPVKGSPTCMARGRCIEHGTTCINNIHAEQDAILTALKFGTKIPKNCVVYITLSPCIECIKLLLELNIETIYIKELHSSFTSVKSYIKKAGLYVSLYDWEGKPLN